MEPNISSDLVDASVLAMGGEATCVRACVRALGVGGRYDRLQNKHEQKFEE